MPSKRLTHVHEVVITDTTPKYKNVENLLHRHILQKEFNFLAFWHYVIICRFSLEVLSILYRVQIKTGI